MAFRVATFIMGTTLQKMLIETILDLIKRVRVATLMFHFSIQGQLLQAIL